MWWRKRVCGSKGIVCTFGLRGVRKKGMSTKTKRPYEFTLGVPESLWKGVKVQVWCVWWLMLDKRVTFFLKWYVFPPKSSKKVGFLYSFPHVTAPTLNMARSHTSPLHVFFSFREKIWVNGWFAHWCAIHMNELNVVTMRHECGSLSQEWVGGTWGNRWILLVYE